MNKKRHRIFNILIATFVFVHLNVALGIPIGSRCELNVQFMRNRWSENVDSILANLNKRLVQRLGKRYRFWEFEEQKADTVVFLLFSVDEKGANDIYVTLKIMRGINPPAELLSLQESWLKPADVYMRGIPPSKLATDSLETAFTNLLIEEKYNELFNALKKYVPISNFGEWIPSQNSKVPYNAVLCLPWQRYSELSFSEFRLACEWHPRPGYAEIITKAFGDKSSYVDPVTNVQSDGILTAPQRWTYTNEEIDMAGTAKREFKNLNPCYVFLEAFVDFSPFLELGSQP